MLGQNQKVVEIMQKGLQTKERIPCLYGLLGNALMELNRLDEAEDAFKQLIKLTPNVFFAYLQMAEVLSRQERWEEARSNLDEALELAPNDFRIHLELAQLYSRTAKPAEAEQELRTALRLRPTDAMVLNNFGYFLLEQDKDLAEAFKMVERAVAADPQNASYLDSLGWAYFKLDNFDLAEKYITESLKQRGGSPEVLEHLGDVYWKQGKEEMARQKWREALAVFLNRVQAERLKQKLGTTAK
jgi:Tfp pilus assembly protein PilF